MIRKLRTILICALIAAICSFIVGCGPKFTITFNGNGGTLVSGRENQSVSAISEIVQPVYEREGYDFMGFDKDLSQMSGGTKTTLNAMWQAKKYTLDLTVGEEVDKISVRYDDEYNLPILEKDYYDFVGWSIGQNGDELLDTQGTFKHTENLSLFPVWKPTEYAIEYNLDGGRFVTNNPKTYTVENQVVFSSPTKDGYDFVGWLNEDTEEPIIKIEKGSYGALNLVATYLPKTFGITIDPNGGSCDVDRVDAIYDQTIENLPFPERVGFTFDGWYLSTNQTERVYNGETYQFTKNITVVASWSSNPYSITYKLNGGKLTAYNPGSYAEDDEITLNAPAKMGYTFIGWKELGVNGYTDKIEKGSSGDKVFTAVYTANKYTLYLNALGGTLNNAEIEVTYDQQIGDLPEATKKGAILNRYTINGVRISSKTIWKFTSDMTAEAVYTNIQYRLNFDLDGGKTLENRTTYTIEGLTGIINPTKLNYTFEGWEVIGSSKVITNGEIPAGSTGELNLKAKWKFKFTTITIRFVLEDTSLSDSVSTIKTCTANGMTSVPPIKISVGKTLGNMLPTNVVPDNIEDCHFVDFCVLNGDNHTLKVVNAKTTLNEAFFKGVDLGEDGVLTLYTRLIPDHIGPY